MSILEEQSDKGPHVCIYVEISPWRKHCHIADDFSRRYFQMHSFEAGEELMAAVVLRRASRNFLPTSIMIC